MAAGLSLGNPYVLGCLLLSSGFVLYVCMFGASSSGFIGYAHDVLTGCPCLRPIFRRCFGPRVRRAFDYVEDVCCWRPNPALQLFYVALMAEGQWRPYPARTLHRQVDGWDFVDGIRTSPPKHLCFLSDLVAILWGALLHRYQEPVFPMQMLLCLYTDSEAGCPDHRHATRQLTLSLGHKRHLVVDGSNQDQDHEEFQKDATKAVEKAEEGVL